jgi:peptide/nickel transport system permease protein
MPEGAAASAGRSGLAAGVLLTLAVAGACAPLLANDRPILARVKGRLEWPALREIPVVGRLFDLPGSGAVDWSAPGAEVHILLSPPVPYSYRGIRLDEALRPPGPKHLLGTDALGRDLLARIIHGARPSLLIAFGATALALLFGACLGAVAALRGGIVDVLVLQAVQIVSCFPPLILAMAFVAASGHGGLLPLVAGIALYRSTGFARFVRGEIIRQRSGDLWAAARSTGASLPRLALRHLFPLLAPTLSVMAAFGVAQSILIESGLSFLGLGVEPPSPSWGAVLAEARGTLGVAWWPVLFPSAALAIVLGALCAATNEKVPGKRGPSGS